MSEVWKPIVGFERYDVSNLGNIKRGEKILKPWTTKAGYSYVGLYKNGTRKKKRIHVLVASAFCVKKHTLQNQVDHINRIKTDNRDSNLRWVTATENLRNRLLLSFSIEIIERILLLSKQGLSPMDIASKIV